MAALAEVRLFLTMRMLLALAPPVLRAQAVMALVAL
jgi:hypothetical protein